jgi:hypothetical protein
MTKIANVIAVELAILIALISWLVFSDPFTERRASADMPESAAEPVTTSPRLPEARPQYLAMIDSNPDRGRVPPREPQPIAVPQPYAQAIPPQPYANPAYQNGVLAAETPSYEEAGQESEVVPSDYATSTDTLAYAEPAPIVYYPVPYQVVVFSNANHFRHRHRPAFHSGAFPTHFPRRPNPGPFHPNRSGMVNPWNAHPGAQQGFKLSGRR